MNGILPRIHDNRYLTFIKRRIDALVHAGRESVGNDWNGDLPAIKRASHVLLHRLCQAVRNGHHRVLSAGIPYSFHSAATCDKARCNIRGSALPRFSARRRIP